MSKGRYTEYQQLNLPAISKEILDKWDNDNDFNKSIELREGKEPLYFMKVRPVLMENQVFIM